MTTVSTSETPHAAPAAARSTSRAFDIASRYGVAVAVHVALLVVWQIAADFSTLPAYLLPSPLEIVSTLAEPTNRWVENSFVTAIEIYGGFVLAVVFGLSTAVLFSWSRYLFIAVMPLLVTLNMIPKVALGPIIIVWLSYGILTNTMIAFAICFFPILITTARGLREIEPELIDLVRTLKASRWQVFRKIQFPGSLPYLFSGMKVSAVLAVAGAVVGEFIGSEKGLAYLMLQMQVNLDTATMVMAVTLITLIGVVLYGGVALLENALVNRGGRA